MNRSGQKPSKWMAATPAPKMASRSQDWRTSAVLEITRLIQDMITDLCASRLDNLEQLLLASTALVKRFPVDKPVKTAVQVLERPCTTSYFIPRSWKENPWSSWYIGAAQQTCCLNQCLTGFWSEHKVAWKKVTHMASWLMFKTIILRCVEAATLCKGCKNRKSVEPHQWRCHTGRALLDGSELFHGIQPAYSTHRWEEACVLIGMAGCWWAMSMSHNKLWNSTSFTHRNKKNSTELSKYIWQLKVSGSDFSITWKVLKRTKSYSNSTNSCSLCNWEKYFIITKPTLATLNKRNELVTACRHRAKYSLKNFITWLF